MIRTKTQNISEALNLFIKAFNLEHKLKEVQLINSWESVTGKMVAKATKSIYIKDKVLYLSISSSIIRNELIMIREGLIQRLNDNAGEEVITGIVIR
jgi:predicted nucleic acid-binding Zn ribbon protein